jgi:type IX secretion system PorP/SprF family membrane protein
MLFAFRVFSQETSIYHNYWLSPCLINPAITGSEDNPSIELSAKKQWLGIPNSPTTFILAGNYRVGNYGFYNPKGKLNKSALKLKDRVGLGAALVGDQNGPSRLIEGMLSYAYHVPLKNKSHLSFGLSLTGTYYSFNSSILKPDVQNDPYLYSGDESKFKVNFNLGSYYYTDKYFAGFSITKILPDITLVNGELKEQPGLFLYGGYKFFPNKLNNLEQVITIKRIANKDTYVDLMTKLYFHRLNWIALAYSTSGNIDVLFGLHITKMMYVGYDYGYTLGKIAPYNNGSHKIFIGMNLGLIRVKNVRKTADDTYDFTL